MSSRTLYTLQLLAAAFVCTLPLQASAQTIWYVDADVNTNQTNDGTSWATAYPTLQQALADASTNAVPADEIWVARGTYISVSQSGSAFSLRDGVAIYGGFTGTEVRRDDRDENPLTNETILTCDVSGSTAIVRAEGSGANLSQFTELDGFSITGGSEHGIVTTPTHNM